MALSDSEFDCRPLRGRVWLQRLAQIAEGTRSPMTTRCRGIILEGVRLCSGSHEARMVARGSDDMRALAVGGLSF